MTKVFCHRGQPVTADYTVQLPPDVRACIFWLRNRRPEEWRENRPAVAEKKDEPNWVSELEAASERVRLEAVAEHAARKAAEGTAAACPGRSREKQSRRSSAGRGRATARASMTSNSSPPPGGEVR